MYCGKIRKVYIKIQEKFRKFTEFHYKSKSIFKLYSKFYETRLYHSSENPVDLKLQQVNYT